MDAKLIQLESWGCDIKNALGRMLDDEEVLLDCIRQVAQDESFRLLGECLEAKDKTGAFEAAHSLKGILANTGITPLYNLVVEIVEPLRFGKDDNLMPLYEKLLEKRKELSEILS